MHRISFFWFITTISWLLMSPRRPFAQIVDLPFSHSTIEPNEEEVEYFIGIESNPSGARIFLDHIDTALKTIGRRENEVHYKDLIYFWNLSEGLHRITLKKPGYLDCTFFISGDGSGRWLYSPQLCLEEDRCFSNSMQRAWGEPCGYLQLWFREIKIDQILIDGEDPSPHQLSCAVRTFHLEEGEHDIFIVKSNDYKSTEIRSVTATLSVQANALSLFSVNFFTDDNGHPIPQPMVWADPPALFVQGKPLSSLPPPPPTSDESKLIFVGVGFLLLLLSIGKLIRRYRFRKHTSTHTSTKTPPPPRTQPQSPQGASTPPPPNPPDPNLDYIRKFLEEQAQKRR